MSIRSRLLILVLLAILVPGLLVGLRFFQDRIAGIAAAKNSLSELAQVITHDLDQKINGTAQLLYGLARARDLDTTDRVACSRFLTEVREQNPQYTGILTIKLTGDLFCDSLQSGRELKLADRGYFKKAVSMPKGVALEPTFGRLTGLPVLQIAHAARLETGAPGFVLLASLNLQKFIDGYSAQRQAREILLVAKNGTVLVWLPESEQTTPPGASMVESDLFQAVQNGLKDSGLKAAAAAGKIAVVSQGDRVWAVADAAVTQDAGLYVMVGVPQNELGAMANRRLVQDIGTLVVVSLLLFAGVWTFAELGIRRRVSVIAAMIAKLGQGDLTARIPAPHPKGDLGQLMALLNGTAELLGQQRDAIEDLDQKLRQSQKMEAIGQLTGGIAHDFNNLLTVVLGNAGLLAEHLAAQPQLQGLAEMTAKAAERGAELTSRLLAFARRQPLHPMVLDVNQLIAGMDGLLRRTLGEQIEIKIVQQPGLWPALVDQGQLENALLNLCINARDAMPDGGYLTLEAANADLDSAYASPLGDVAPGQYVMIAVSDTGTGMDSATLERAFEPFFTTKEMGRGSGLGLSMVYGFVKQSKGHVQLYSELGHGTTVRLYLPRAEGMAEIAPQRNSGAVPQGGTEKILLVEDDDIVREHVAAQLVNLGYAVVATGSGADAIALLQGGGDFDLLFTDIVMPGGIDGFRLGKEARALRPTLLVLFTSGYSEHAIEHQGQLESGHYLLAKPFSRQDLAAKVRAVLDRIARP